MALFAAGRKEGRVDLFQLETFLAVAEERSFSRAAARLHRTQPAVSQTIAKLEAELGEVLLERSSRDGTLTDAGEVLDEFRRRNPRIKVTVQRALASRIADDVLVHAVEIGVLSFRPDDPQIRSVVVYRDELDFVVNPNHALAGADEVSIRQ